MCVCCLYAKSVIRCLENEIHVETKWKQWSSMSRITAAKMPSILVYEPFVSIYSTFLTTKSKIMVIVLHFISSSHSCSLSLVLNISESIFWRKGCRLHFYLEMSKIQSEKYFRGVRIARDLRLLWKQSYLMGLPDAKKIRQMR